MKKIISTVAAALTLALVPAAFADQPARPNEVGFVRGTSQQLERTMRTVDGFTEVQAYGRSYGQSLAARYVDRFHDQSRLFALKAKRAAKDGEIPDRMDYLQLRRSYDNALQAMQWLQMYGRASVDMRDVHELMRGLDQLYRG